MKKNFLDIVRNILDISKFPYIAFFPWPNRTTYTVTRILLPIEQVVFFYLLGVYTGGSTDLDFYIIGNSVLLVTNGGMYAISTSINREKQAGTLIYTLAIPKNHLLIFWSRLTFYILDSILSATIGLIFGAIIGINMKNTSFPLLFIALFITSVSASSLGFMLGSLSIRYFDAIVLNNLAYPILLFFTGANIPLGRYPPFIQFITFLLPLTRGIEAIREIITGEKLSYAINLIAQEFLLAIIYAIIASSLFVIFELKSIKQGTIEYV